jgi:hypothetical protein
MARALERSGRAIDGFELASDDMDKWNVPTPRPSRSEPIPLEAVYLLQKPKMAQRTSAASQVSRPWTLLWPHLPRVDISRRKEERSVT